VVTEEHSDVPPTPEAPKPDRTRLLVVLAVVILGAGIFWFLNSSEDDPAAPDGETEEYATIEDPEAGFSIKLPQNWQFFEQEQTDPEIRMVAGAPGTQNNLRVRVSPLPSPVVIDADTPDNVIAELQGQFDQYIDQGEAVKEVLQRQRVNINGVQGWEYLYTFTNEPSSEEGVHSHFFLLGGDRLYVLVFQVLPSSSYEDYARTFDEIITSFQLIDEDQPADTEEPAASPSPSPSS
jgi:hypothetical protein